MIRRPPRSTRTDTLVPYTTLFRSRAASATMPWGGAMALTRETAERLDLDAALAGRLSDDMTIGLAGWRAKLRLRPVRDLLVASRSEEHTSELPSLMRISYAVFCLQKKTKTQLTLRNPTITTD